MGMTPGLNFPPASATETTQGIVEVSVAPSSGSPIALTEDGGKLSGTISGGIVSPDLLIVTGYGSVNPGGEAEGWAPIVSGTITRQYGGYSSRILCWWPGSPLQPVAIVDLWVGQDDPMGSALEVALQVNVANSQLTNGLITPASFAVVVAVNSTTEAAWTLYGLISVNSYTNLQYYAFYEYNTDAQGSIEWIQDGAISADLPSGTVTYGTNTNRMGLVSASLGTTYTTTATTPASTGVGVSPAVGGRMLIQLEGGANFDVSGSYFYYQVYRSTIGVPAEGEAPNSADQQIFSREVAVSDSGFVYEFTAVFIDSTATPGAATYYYLTTEVAGGSLIVAEASLIVSNII